MSKFTLHIEIHDDRPAFEDDPNELVRIIKGFLVTPKHTQDDGTVNLYDNNGNHVGQAETKWENSK